MSTREAAMVAGGARDRAPASRIVRIGRAAGPWLAGLTVLATVAFAVPNDAWLPRGAGALTGAAWTADAGPAMDALAALQVWLGGWLWAPDVVGGAIGLAASCAAATAALLTSTLRKAGLRADLATLLTLVAAAAPFAAWSASSPLGAAPVTLCSALLLTWLARHLTGDGTAARNAARPTRLATLGLAALGIALLVLPGDAGARARDTSAFASSWELLRRDLALTGLLLLAVGGATLARADSARRIWLGVAAVCLLTLPFPAEIRVAAALPWAWWFVGVGVARVIACRGGGPGWAGAGLVVWLALHVAARPWGHERQQAALVGTWARAMAEHLTDTQPLVIDGSPRGRLLAALVSRHARGSSSPAVITASEAYAATSAGRHPVVLSAGQLETLRWSGVAFAPWNTASGASIEDILDALPAGTVTLAVISADAAGRLSPRQWQALGRAGLRLPDAATGRAHALAGVTGARVQALEVAQAGSVRLDVQPGDVLGRTAARSPVDGRLEAGATHVSIWLRGEALVDQAQGLALAFFTTRGDLLGWRAGARPDHLDGPALGTGSATRAVATAALPCMTIPGGRETDVTSLTGSGALGVTWTAPARIDVSFERPRQWQPSVVRVAPSGPDATGPLLMDQGTGDRAFALQGRPPQTTGVYLRGPVSRALARTDRDLRVCAAWPMAFATVSGSLPVTMPVAPRNEPHFGGGWHDMEVQPGTGYFRWMSGSRAQVLLALQRPMSFTFALDAQAPITPEPGDQVRLAIAGREIGAQALLPTRGIYVWQVPADAVRTGMNAIVLTITRTARPAPGHSGDVRELGLLVRGWTIGPPGPDRP